MSDKPSISELQRANFDRALMAAELPHELRDLGYKDSAVSHIIGLILAAPVLLEIAETALAADSSRSALYADPGPSIDKARQLNLMDAHEAALVRFRDAIEKVRP